jgi:hypothetical protein
MSEEENIPKDNLKEQPRDSNKEFEYENIPHPFVFDKMVTINGINRPDNNPPLRSYDISIQQDLAAYVHTIKGSTFIIESRLELLNNKAKNIINFLKKEYHLE